MSPSISEFISTIKFVNLNEVSLLVVPSGLFQAAAPDKTTFVADSELQSSLPCGIFVGASINKILSACAFPFTEKVVPLITNEALSF